MSQAIAPLVLKELTPRVQDLIRQHAHQALLTMPEIIQPGLPSVAFLISRIRGLFGGAWKVYFPVHFLLMLYRLKTSKHSKKDTLKRFAKELSRSLAFATLYGYSMPLSVTYVRPLYNLLGNGWAGTVVAFSFSTFILLETRSRLGEMSIYVLGKWFEGYTYSLRKRAIIPDVPHIEKLFFGIALGLISSLYFGSSATELDEQTPKEKIKMETMINLLIGEKHFKY